MLPRNNGITENEILQNQFTAYVSRAVRNRRLRYIMNRDCKNSKELLFSQLQDFVSVEDDPISELLEYEVLKGALRQIREKERAIILARVVEEKSFGEIAKEMDMTYKAVTNMYYRIMKRLKACMEGVDEE